MEKVYINNYKGFRVLISFFAFLFFSSLLTAQSGSPDLEPDPFFDQMDVIDTIQLDNSGNDDELLPTDAEILTDGADIKSASESKGGSWNALSNGSDYYIYFTWSGLGGNCPCSNNITYASFRNNGSQVSRANDPAGSYSGTGYKHGIGPSQTGKYTLSAPYTGKTYVISSSFDCIYSCSGTVSSTSTLTRSTSALKAPTNVKASNRTSDTKITLTWTIATHVPADKHHYLIYRDGVQVGTTAAGAKTYTDTGLEPGRQYTYRVYTRANTWNKTSSSSALATGYTFHLNLQATTDSKTSVNLSWTKADNIGATSYRIERQEPDGLWVEIGNPTGFSEAYKDDSPGLISGYLYNYRVTPQPQGTFLTYNTQGKKLADGNISGKVTAPAGGGVDEVTITVKRLTDNIVQGDLNPTEYYGVSKADGSYTVENIYYYEGANFLVTPSKGDHGFKPGDAEQYIDSKLTNTLNFTDTSSFSISGNITMNNGMCYAPGVEIYVNDVESGVFTDAEGNYSITVPLIDNYTFEPKMEGHTFNPEKISLFVGDNIENVSFDDTTSFNLSGYVKASCDVYIGQADVRIFSKNQPGCYDTTLVTDANTGFYSIDLPPQEYNVDIVAFNTADDFLVSNQEVLDYFSIESVDLTYGDQMKNFILRKPPILTVTGFEVLGCGDYLDVPIVQQGHEYIIEFEVNESLGASVCPADTGFVVIYDGLVNGPVKVDTLYLVDGKVSYHLFPGDPNIIPPHTRLLEATAFVEGEQDEYSQQILITGNHPRESTYASVSPEIPFMILRDPPGDASYSYLSEGSTTETALRFSSRKSGSLNAWAEVKAGVAFSAGSGVSFDFAAWGSINASLEVGASVSDENEFSMSITNNQEFTTSSNPDVIGEQGDVYAGAAMNIIYALTDVIEYDEVSCKVNKYAEIIMGVDGFETTFIYTENHIANVLIPQLEQLRDIYLSQGSDSAKIYQNQVSAWQQTLDINRKLKEKASFIENRSFSSGSKYESFTELSVTKSSTIEFDMYIEASVAREVGIEAAGSGVSAGVEAKFRMDFGNSVSGSNTTTKKTGYVLDDDDAGDFFSVDILADEVYGTPVFNPVSGRSSCPWEINTQPREGVQLISDSYVQYVNDPEGQAVFRLQLGNTTQSDEDMLYNLVFLQESNPDGAVLTLGGSQVQGGIPIPYFVPAGGFKEATVTVNRGPLAYDYNNLQFAWLSGCDDPNISDTVSLNVHFTSPCSEINILRPYDNWVVNSSRESLLLRLGGYDASLLTTMKIQYAEANSNDWVTDFTIAPEDLEEGITELEWSFTHLNDGAYDLRAAVECSNGNTYSGVFSGVIDRNAPRPYALPEPSDLVLDEEDLISVTFDEMVSCSSIGEGNVSITNISSGDSYPVQIGCFENVLIFIPELPANATFTNDTFLVELTGVEDMYGNISEDTVSWAFVVPGAELLKIDENADTDEDGIINKDDNCPYSYNPEQEDMDQDGIGDQCDEDIDGDGIDNSSDNCISTPNTGQEDVNLDGIGDVCQVLTAVAPSRTQGGFDLLENYPNPFNMQTTIRFNVPVESRVIIRIHDARGSEVAVLTDNYFKEGIHEVSWDSWNNAGGLYFYTMDAMTSQGTNVYRQTKKMMLVE